jgi:ParB family chromosome partitioning protein
MAKNSIDAYGAIGKSNVLFFDPEGLHLVVDEKSPLYDDRVKNPPVEKMVRNLMAKGVRVPIIIAKNPETGLTEVVDGRQRVINAREANRRLVAQGGEPIQVPGMVSKFTGNGGDLADVMVLTNELREQDMPINRAKKMQRLADLGRDEAAIGLVFGCTVQTVRSTLALLECSAAVRSAVEAGTVNVGQALKLAKMQPEEQRAKVAELVAAGVGAAPRERTRKQREVLGTTAAPKMRARREIVAMRDSLVASSESARILEWVLGAAPLVKAPDQLHDGEHAPHQPSEFESLLIVDAIAGLHASDEWAEAYHALDMAHHDAKRGGNALRTCERCKSRVVPGFPRACSLSDCPMVTAAGRTE